MKKQLVSLAFTAAVGLLSSSSPMLASDTDTHEFNMVVSAGAKTCLPNASATVRVRPAGSVEIMDVSVQGLPANADFNFFVLQVPKAPFGVAWYQGDVTTDRNGRGHAEFMGRFSVETFAFAQNSAPALPAGPDHVHSVRSRPGAAGCAVHSSDTRVPSTPEIAHSTCGHTAVGDEWTKITPRVLTADLRCRRGTSSPTSSRHDGPLELVQPAASSGSVTVV